MDDGVSLYIKSGYKGSGINEVVSIGDVVGGAAALCKNGSREADDGEFMVSERVRDMLKEKYQGFLSWSHKRACYQSSIHNVGMNEWVGSNG